MQLITAPRCTLLVVFLFVNEMMAQPADFSSDVLDIDAHSLQKRSLDSDYYYDSDSDFSFLKRGLGLGHALRIKKSDDDDIEASSDEMDFDKRGVGLGHTLRIKKRSGLGLGHALRIKKGDLSLGHALRIKRPSLSSASRHALRIKKDFEDPLSEYSYYDAGQTSEPYIKRQISRSHILRAI